MNGTAPFDEPGRKNPAAGVPFRVGGPNLVLLTVNTEQRTPWLATPEVHRLLHQTWQEATAWLVGDYLLMPDHLHCFCAPHDLRFDIEPWITYWKRELRRKHGRGGMEVPVAWLASSHPRRGPLRGEVALRPGESDAARPGDAER